MKIYLAGQCPYPEALAHARRTHGRFLYSFHYYRKKRLAEIQREWEGQDIFLDSGGFSVRKRGQTIDVKDYLKFLVLTRGLYSTCFNLDTADVDETLANQRFLESRRIRPLPIYHYSDWAVTAHRPLLDRYLEQYDHISLGGMAGGKLTRDQHKRFLSWCFSRIPKTVKVHGLGVTSVHLMSYYPFYSVDSKTWLVSGLYGDFITTKDAKYKRSPKKKDKLTHHGILLPGPEKMKRAVDAFHQLERHLTAIWAKRGYVWNS